MIWKHSFIRHAGDQMITALYSLVGLMSLTSLVLSIALFESKKLSTFLPRKCNVCGIMFETLLTVNVKCLKELNHIASVHIAYFFYCKFQTLKTYWQNHLNLFLVSFFFLLGFTTSEFIPLLCSNFCFFVYLFVVVFFSETRCFLCLWIKQIV